MAWYDPTSWDWEGAGNAIQDGASSVKNWLVGGDASKGMSNGPQTADYQRNYLSGYLSAGSPVMNTGQVNETRGQQQQLSDMLFKTASGQAPGAGELAVQRGVNSAQAGQVSMAQMARGANTAMAMRNAARNSADIGVNGAGQRGIAQLNDKNAAMGQLGQVLGQTRSQDIQVAGANQQAELAQRQLQLGALAQMLGVDQAQLQQELAKRGIDMNDKGMLGSLLQIGGQIGAAYAGRPQKPPGT